MPPDRLVNLPRRAFVYFNVTDSLPVFTYICSPRYCDAGILLYGSGEMFAAFPSALMTAAVMDVSYYVCDVQW